MAALEFDLKIEDKVIQRRLQKLSAAGGNTKLAFQDIGEYLIQTIDERFTNQEDPDGNSWAELNDDYKETKKHQKILTESSELRQSYIYRASNNEVIAGSNLIYAGIHQFGGKTKAHQIRPKYKKALFWSGATSPVAYVNHPGSDIPARPVLGLNAADKKEILIILREHYMMALRSN